MNSTTHTKTSRSPRPKPRTAQAPGSAPPRDEHQTRAIAALVNDAAQLIESKGRAAFPELRVSGSRWRTGETYVFVMTPQGDELVNGGQPEMEGTNLAEVKDVKGKPFIRQILDAAQKDGSGWTEYYWYKPGDDTPCRKNTYARLVRCGEDAYVVGSGFYAEP